MEPSRVAFASSSSSSCAAVPPVRQRRRSSTLRLHVRATEKRKGKLNPIRSARARAPPAPTAHLQLAAAAVIRLLTHEPQPQPQPQPRNRAVPIAAHFLGLPPCGYSPLRCSPLLCSPLLSSPLQRFQPAALIATLMLVAVAVASLRMHYVFTCPLIAARAPR